MYAISLGSLIRDEEALAKLACHKAHRADHDSMLNMLKSPLTKNLIDYPVLFVLIPYNNLIECVKLCYI